MGLRGRAKRRGWAVRRLWRGSRPTRASSTFPATTATIRSTVARAQVDGFWWQDQWDNFTGPAAKAYHLLKTLDLGDADSKLRQAGHIIFQVGGAPGFPYHWAELKDDLTVSLLQARLIELNLPINVKIAASWGGCA